MESQAIFLVRVPAGLPNSVRHRMTRPNHRDGVDAESPLLIAFERFRSGTTYRGRWPLNHYSYRKRIYFFDRDGNDWEFVQYLTDDPAKRHDYTIPDK